MFQMLCLQIQEHLNTLEEKYNESVDQRESLKEHQRTTQLRLQRASILIGALADEKVSGWACLSGRALKPMSLMKNMYLILLRISHACTCV